MNDFIVLMIFFSLEKIYFMSIRWLYKTVTPKQKTIHRIALISTRDKKKRKQGRRSRFSLSARSINTAVMYVENHFFSRKEYKFTQSITNKSKMVAGKTMILISITLLMCIIDQAVGINIIYSFSTLLHSFVPFSIIKYFIAILNEFTSCFFNHLQRDIQLLNIFKFYQYNEHYSLL